MRAKLVNESLFNKKKFKEPSTEEKACAIADAIYIIYNWDDIETEPNYKEIKKVQNLLNVIVGIDDIEELGSSKWTLSHISDDNIEEIYRRLVEHGFIIE